MVQAVVDVTGETGTLSLIKSWHDKDEAFSANFSARCG